MTTLSSAPPEIPPLQNPSIAMDKAAHLQLIRSCFIPFHQRKINVTITENRS